MKLAALATVLTIGIVGPLAAQTNVNDPPPVGPNIPVVRGEVTNVSSHTVGVRTTRGEAMTFEADSRTVMPARLMAGKRVKVEFRLMENGTHHAGRITVIEPGSYDWEQYDEELAMHTRETDTEPLASSESHPSEPSTTGTNGYSGNEPSGSAMNDATTSRQETATNRLEDTGSTADELPQTASRQPMLLGLGLAALALGLVIGLARRRRSV